MARRRGAVVAEDDPLVEIQTDKATVEIPSPYAGTVLRILVSEGEVAPVGAVLVVIGEPGEAVPEDAPMAPAPSAPPPPREAKVAATPLVRKIAAELGVDLASVTGSGPEGGSPRRTCVPASATGSRARVAESPSAAFVA